MSTKELRHRFWQVAATLAMVANFAGGVAAQEIRVVLLGTGTPRPMIERFGMSTLVLAGGETLLFDAGRGCTIRLAQAGVPLKEVSKLFLTHLHSDHTVGIPDLWLTGWIFDRQGALEVWGPQGTKQMVAGLEEAYAYDVHVRRDVDEKLSPEGTGIRAHEIEEGVVYERGGVKVTAFLVDHGPVKPAFGYRVEYGGRSVVLSGDTRPSENVVKHAQAADVLIHEVYALPENAKPTALEATIVAHHSTPEQAGEIFSRVKPRLAVYSHIGKGNVSAEELIRRTRKTYQGRLEVGEDLREIDVGKEISVKQLPLTDH